MGLFSRRKKKKINLTTTEKKDLEKDQELLSAVAAINAANGSYESPFASMSSFKKISPLTYACETGMIARVKEAINNGSDVNETDEDGTTPIHAAAKNGYLEIVKLLLELGADKNRSNTDGLLPIDLAEEKGHQIIADLLRND
jgi:ankyrin repeat protein